MKKIFLISLLLGISSASFAKKTGFYVGLSGGLVSSETYLLEDGSFGAKSNTGGAGAFGYLFNKYLATEISYLYIGNSSANGIDQNQSFLTANVKGILPLNEQFNLFAKAGIGYNFANINGNSAMVTHLKGTFNSNNIASLFGVGLSYNLTKCLQLSVADDYYFVTAPKFNNSDASPTSFGYGNTNFFNVGVSYKF